MGVRDRRGGGVGGEGRPHPPTPSTTSNIPRTSPHTSFSFCRRALLPRLLSANLRPPAVRRLATPLNHATPPTLPHNITLCIMSRSIIQGAPSSNCSAARRPTRPLTALAAVQLCSRRAPAQMAPPRRRHRVANTRPWLSTTSGARGPHGCGGIGHGTRRCAVLCMRGGVVCAAVCAAV